MYFHYLTQIYSVYSDLDIHETKLARDLIRRNDAGIYECGGVKSVKYDGDFSACVCPWLLETTTLGVFLVC